MADAAMRTAGSAEKARGFLEQTEQFLRDEKLEEAEQAVNRVSMIQLEIDGELLAKFNFMHATVLDRRGKYIEAASKFYDLSTSPFLSADERRNVLQQAVVCVVLSPESALRKRLLPALFNDERCRELIGFNIIQKIYLNRLITVEDVAHLNTALSPQKKSQFGEHLTIEHNIVALSKLFKNITYEKMAKFVNSNVETVERLAAEMITQGRLSASLDQAQSLLVFEKSAKRGGLDQHFATLCQEANSIYERILELQPEWYEQHFSQSVEH